MCRAMNRAWLLILSTAGMFAAPPVSSDLTIILDFKGPRSARAVIEMERETQAIFQEFGLRLSWRLREDAAQSTYPDLVVVQFQGACVLQPAPYLYDELGPSEPLAFTYTTDGTVQPFSQVACDKVAASARSAMWGGDFARADLLLGRALGRVLAHELVHILTGSGQHSPEGVEKRTLSPKQLTAASLPLSAADLARLRLAYKSR